MMLRPRHRHAWSSLAWGLLFLVLLTTLAELFAPAKFEETLDPRYYVRRDRLRQRRELQNPDAPLVVLLGSSRINNSLDGKLAEANLGVSAGRQVVVANFGTPGSGPYHSLTILGRLIRDGLKPDVVIVEVLPTYLVERDWGSMTSSTWVRFNVADESWLKKRGVHIDAVRDPWPVLFRHRTEFLKLACTSISLPATEESAGFPADTWGAALIGSDIDPERRQKGLAVAYEEYYETLRSFQFGTKGLEGLRLVLEECNRNQIRSLLVLMPEGPNFRSWYRADARREIEQRLADLADACDSRLVVSSEWIAEEDFADSHHLLACGATKFTDRLTREAVSDALQADQRLGDARPIAVRRAHH